MSHCAASSALKSMMRGAGCLEEIHSRRFPIETDPGGPWIPFDEPIGEAECQSAELIPPNEFQILSHSKFDKGVRYRIISEMVERCKV